VEQARQRNRFIKIGVSKASAKTVITVIPKTEGVGAKPARMIENSPRGISATPKRHEALLLNLISCPITQPVPSFPHTAARITKMLAKST
jgi:hypothetical protein